MLVSPVCNCHEAVVKPFQNPAESCQVRVAIHAYVHQYRYSHGGSLKLTMKGLRDGVLRKIDVLMIRTLLAFLQANKLKLKSLPE